MITGVSLPKSPWIRSPAQTALLPASQASGPSRSVPAVLERAGANALFAADEFFAARISNPHIRHAYARVVRRFLAWCEDEHLKLPQVSPDLTGLSTSSLPRNSRPFGPNECQKFTDWVDQ